MAVGRGASAYSTRPITDQSEYDLLLQQQQDRQASGKSLGLKGYTEGLNADARIAGYNPGAPAKGPASLAPMKGSGPAITQTLGRTRPSLSAAAPKAMAPSMPISAPKAGSSAVPSMAPIAASGGAASLPIASKPPSMAGLDGGGDMGMSEGAAGQSLSGPTSGRTNIGNRLPPSLAALLRPRVY